MLDKVIVQKLSLAEKQRNDTLNYIKEQTKLAVLMNDLDSSPANYQRQLGRSMTTDIFEAKLKKLSPNYVFEQNPVKPDKKWLYYLTPEGRTFVSAYENGIVPEHSIRAAKDEEIWNEDIVKTKIVGGYPVKHINKADLPKSEYVPGKGLIWDTNTSSPAFKKIQIPWHEAFRGWRTVLIYIVKKGLATPSEVEAIFGIDDRPEWKQHLGRGHQNVIW